MATKSKTTWTAGEGVITFILPNKTTHQFDASTCDRPITTCEVLDVLAGMSQPERRAIVSMLDSLDKKGG